MPRVAHLRLKFILTGLLLSGLPALLLVDHPPRALQAGAVIGLVSATALAAVVLSRWANALEPPAR